MLSTLLIVSWLAAQAPAAKPVGLPDTPQGRHVDAYIKAFNTGDAKAFLAAHEKTVVPELLARRTAEEHAQMFQRLRGDFRTLRITRLVRSTPAQIAFVALLTDGNEGTFTFDFEDKAPFRISRIAIDVERPEAPDVGPPAPGDRW